MRKEKDDPLLLIGSLCLCESGRSTVTFMPEKASAPAAPSPGFSSLIPLFEDSFIFFSFAASAFFFLPRPPPLSLAFPQQVLYCLPSSLHTLIACISHRSPLANCIILMVFFKIVHCGEVDAPRGFLISISPGEKNKIIVIKKKGKAGRKVLISSLARVEIAIVSVL